MLLQNEQEPGVVHPAASERNRPRHLSNFDSAELHLMLEKPEQSRPSFPGVCVA